LGKLRPAAAKGLEQPDGVARERPLCFNHLILQREPPALGDKYVGQFANGVRNGKGVYHFANGDTRDMQFDNGVEKPN